MPQFIDLTGQTYNRLTAKRYEGSSRWLCDCKCGGFTVVDAFALRGGNTKSCGCLKAESLLRKKPRASALYRRRSYRAWSAARKRCTQSSNSGWKLYGGRGITMCPRWLNSYPAFLEDMGEPEDQKLELDRIDANGNYEPGNCRWATDKEQARNRRDTIWVDWEGRRIPLIEACETLGIRYVSIYHHLKKGIAPLEALRLMLTPASIRRRQKIADGKRQPWPRWR